jgi:hypothetical protein
MSPVGAKDFTESMSLDAYTIEKLPIDIIAQTLSELKVNITAQAVATLKVDIVAQSVGNLNINIAASAVTLNVSIVSSTTLNINISSISAGVVFNVAQSGSWTINIGGPLDASGNVKTAILSSVRLDVNIAASAVTLNVNIASSAVTLNVAIQSAVTLNVNISSISAGVVFNVAQSGSWTVNAAQTGTWTINIGAPLDASGNLKAAILSSVQLDVNIAASAVTLNMNIASISAGVVFNVAQSGSWTINIGGPLDASGNVKTAILSSVQLDVNIAAQAVRLDVNIASSQVTLNVNIASAVTLNINISSISAGVVFNVAQSGSWTINIGGPLDASGNVKTAILSSVQLDVNIAASAVTLNVNIASSAVTLNVAIQSSAVTLNVAIQSSAVTLNVNLTNPAVSVGQVKPALAFDGVNDYVEVPDSSSIQTPSEVTLEMWVKTDNTSKPFYIYKGSGVSARAYTARLLWDGSNFELGFCTPTAEIYWIVPYTLAANQWYHLVFTVKSGEQKFYVNGALVDTETYTYTSLDVFAGYPFRINYSPYSAYGYGVTGLVRMYNRALSGDESIYNYNNPQSPITNGLVLWLDFNEGSGTIVHDKSGNNNNGTIYGATWVVAKDPVPPVVNVNITAQQANLKVDIASQSVGDIGVDIKAQTVGNIKVDLAAQSVGNIGVDIKAQSVGNININIAAQAVDIKITNAVDAAGNPIPLKIDVSAQSVGNVGVDIKAQSVGNIGVDIKAQSVGNINVNIAASAVTLNVNITAQSVNLNVYTGSGLKVMAGTGLITKFVRYATSIGTGVELEILSVTGKGRCVSVGLKVYDSAYSQAGKAEIRIYADGALVYQASLDSLDFINGRQMSYALRSGTSTSPVYASAPLLNQEGGVVAGYGWVDNRNGIATDELLRLVEAYAVAKPNIEFNSSLSVRIYNGSQGTINFYAGVEYGLYP